MDAATWRMLCQQRLSQNRSLESTKAEAFQMDSFPWVNMTWMPVQWIYLWSHWVLHQLETERPVLQKSWISWLWTKINPQYVSFMIQVDDAMSIVINTYLYTPTEYHKHLARLNLAGGNKRRDWQECAREEIPADESLRASAQRWLANKKILHSSLSTSTDKGWRTLIARCSRCAACSKAWCFRQLPPSSLLVEHVGECKGPLNLQKVK